jgi:hypothetical protein
VLLQVAEEEVDTSAHTVVEPATLPDTPVTVTVKAPRVVVAAVVTVSVDVSADVPVIETDVGERLHPGAVGFERELVTAQVSPTVPVNEFDGVTVIVEVPLALGATVRLAGEGERVKLVLLPPPGACQKSPQPVRKHARIGVAVSKIRAQLPIFITAPFAPFSRLAIFNNRSQGIARTCILSCHLRPAAQLSPRP